jgi:predicted metal-dependent hydrolase
MLLNKARELSENKEVIVRDSRVSTKYIEFDASLPEGVDVSDLISRLENISPLASYEHIVERHIEKNDAIKRAVELFNDEKYWGTHEALEAVWKETQGGQERELLNGIILIAAAFVHDEKAEHDICMSILRRALKKLEGATGKYHEIDVDRLIALVQRILATGIIERFTI